MRNVYISKYAVGIPTNFSVSHTKICWYSYCIHDVCVLHENIQNIDDSSKVPTFKRNFPGRPYVPTPIKIN